MSKQPSLLQKGATALKIVTFGLAAFQAIRRLRDACLANVAKTTPTNPHAMAKASGETHAATLAAEDAPSPRQEFLSQLMPEDSRPQAKEISPGKPGQPRRMLNFKPIMRGNRMIGKA